MAADDMSDSDITCSPGVFRKPAESPDSRLASVMMPFSAEFNPVFETIRDAAESCGLECKRADDIWDDPVIMQDIFKLIYCASIVVVDFSGRNPNVMYETGIAHTLGRDVIPISQSIHDVPSDMRHQRVLLYLHNSEGLVDLKASLVKRLSGLVSSNNSSSGNRNGPVTMLEKVRSYLEDVSQWSVAPRDDGCNGDFFHEVHPEITIKCTDAPDYIGRDEEWTRGEIRRDNNSAGYFEVCYSERTLARVRYVSFDDHKKSMVAPEWEPCGRGRFYFYEADSIEYSVHRFYCGLGRAADSERIHIRGRVSASVELRELMKRRWGYTWYRIPVLGRGELEAFKEADLYPETDTSDPSRDDREQYELFVRNQLAFERWRESRGDC